MEGHSSTYYRKMPPAEVHLSGEYNNNQGVDGCISTKYKPVNSSCCCCSLWRRIKINFLFCFVCDAFGHGPLCWEFRRNKQLYSGTSAVPQCTSLRWSDRPTSCPTQVYSVGDAKVYPRVWGPTGFMWLVLPDFLIFFKKKLTIW